VNALVADVAALQRDLQVETDLDPGVGTCAVDPDRLRQVLMNLASNARQALEGRDDARLRLATRPDGERFVLVLEDNGPGIPVQERGRLFEPYRSQAKGGLGLGLALVKGIVLAHRGTIEVEEGRWGGARFRIELPRQAVAEPEEDHE
jgi:signal transduction histidine kinase